jgi:hypothetical protein
VAEFRYALLVPRLEAILQADPRLRDAHVTQELDTPTTFPWVRLRMVRAGRLPIHLVAGVVSGYPDDVTPLVGITVWHCSVQSAADACRQRDELVSTLIDVLRDNYTLGGLVNTIQATGVDFGEGRNEGSDGIYARADIALECRVLA